MAHADPPDLVPDAPPPAPPAVRSTGRLPPETFVQVFGQAVAAPASDGDSLAVEPAELEASGLVGAVEAIADITLAPVGNLRSRSWPLRTSALLHFAAAGAATWVGWDAGLRDWQVYLVSGLGTAVLVGNFLRWRRRWGWFRRTLRLGMALAVDAIWGLLLFDRAYAGALSHGDSPAASVRFAIPLLLLVAGAVLAVVHLLLDTKAAKALRR